ncbi:MAG: hypothetical protein K6E88_08845, partial [Lachnospiraceae bacterium]|nr:hypothetical protein [Lachnospiraceae bacterium]
SAVLMGIATSGKGTMTDAEVKERAAALGMVEEDALLVKPKLEETIPALPADDGKNDDKDREDDASAHDVEIKPEEKAEEKKEEAAKEKTEETPVDESADKTEVKTEDKTEDKTEVIIEDKTENKTEDNQEAEDIRAKEDIAMGGQNDNAAPAEPASTDSFTLQIASGTTSFTVAKLLQKGGVIDDAADFDDYLCDNHYDNKINHGVFKIPAGAGYEEIAKIITDRN